MRDIRLVNISFKKGRVLHHREAVVFHQAPSKLSLMFLVILPPHYEIQCLESTFALSITELVIIAILPFPKLDFLLFMSFIASSFDHIYYQQRMINID